MRVARAARAIPGEREIKALEPSAIGREREELSRGI